jgi:hypothetical protein
MTDALRRRSLMTLAVAAAVVLAGCGSSSSPSSAPPSSVPSTTAVASSPVATTSASPTATSAVDLSGTWKGPWVRVTAPAGKGQYTLTIQQSGAELTGTLVVTGSACLSSHPVSGNVLGSLVNFHTTQGPGTGDFSGRLAATGLTMTGTAVVTCAAGVGRASWRLTKS